MKKFYTVKEASKILGFSTNTVYKYLEEGKLKSKRVGLGRFKIPYEELSPYLLETSEVPKVEEKVIPSISLDLERIKTEFKDYVFFRLFLGISILGLGLISLFSADLLLFLVFGPIGGLYTLSCLFRKRFEKYLKLINILGIVSLVYYAYLVFLSKEFLTLVFVLAFIFLLVRELVKIGNSDEKENFIYDFVLLTSTLIVGFGIVFLFFGDTLGVSFLQEFLKTKRLIFTIFWFLLIGAPIFYTYIVKRNLSRLAFSVLGIFGVICFLLATTLSIFSKWNSSFLIYFYSIFTLFLIWWQKSGASLRLKTFYIIVLSFLWVGAAIFLSLFALFSIQESVKRTNIEEMEKNLSEISVNLNYYFDRLNGEVTSSLNRENVLSALRREDSDSAISESKFIFEQIDDLTGVLIIDADGKVLGAYPRNSILQNTDFSNRDYFQKAKTSMRDYTSSVYEPLLSTQLVVQANPIFENNRFVGVVAVIVDIKSLAANLQNLEKEGIFYATDDSGKLILPPDTTKIEASKGVLKTTDLAKIPRWTVYIERSSYLILQSISESSLLISAVIAVNSLFALTAGFLLSKRLPS